jgi:hypothetical protein
VDPNRPEWLPDNFTKPEDLATSYKELQAKMTQQAQELAALKKTDPETPPAPETPLAPDGAPKDGEEKPANQDEAAQKVADAAGVDLNPYSDEFASTGDVTPENRAKIAEGLKGILGDDALDIVNDYIEGKKVLIENDTRMFMDAAGGADQYQSMIAWAQQNYTPEQQAAYNKAIDTGDRQSTLWAIAGLKDAYGKANGLPGRLITPGGSGGVPGGTAPYESAAQMQIDMAKPEYKKDPAFREMVKRRLAVSTF